MQPLAFLAASPSMGEMLVIFLVFLLLFGSRKLPELARGLGRALSEFRRAARDMQDELMHADLDERRPRAAPGVLPPAPTEGPETHPHPHEPDPVEPPSDGAPDPGPGRPHGPG